MGIAPCNDNARLDSFDGRDMRAMLTFGSLLIVLAVIGVSVRSQLRANQRYLPSAQAASAASSAPFGGNASPNPAQFQAELEKTLRQGAAHRADEAASAEDGSH